MPADHAFPAPPPAPRDPQFYLHSNGETSGPHGVGDIHRLFRQRRLRPEAMVSALGDRDWTPLKDHPAFPFAHRRAADPGPLAQAAAIDDPPPLADPFRRIIASGVDVAAVLALQSIAEKVIARLSPAMPNFAALSNSQNPFEAIATAFLPNLVLTLLVSCGVYVAYYTGFLATRRQATPGKMLLGIHVAKADGSAISVADALKRCGGYGIDSLTFGWGYMVALTSPDRRALHDRLCNTDVVEGHRSL